MDKLPTKSNSVSAIETADPAKKSLFDVHNPRLAMSEKSSNTPMLDLREALAKVLANQNYPAGSSGINFPNKAVNTPPLLKRLPSKGDNFKQVFSASGSEVGNSKTPVKSQGKLPQFQFKR